MISLLYQMNIPLNFTRDNVKETNVFYSFFD